MELVSADRPYETRQLNPTRLNAIRKFGGKKVLDVGCGNGSYVFALKDEREVQGLDYRLYEEWSQSPELFRVGSAESLEGYEDSSVDTIVSFETLEHLKDPLKALREYYRVCSRNLIVTVPNCSVTPGIKKSNLLYSHWSDRSHVNFFTLETLAQLLMEAGFGVGHAEYINQIDVRPFLLEAFRLKGYVGKVASKLLRLLPAERYYITCLAIGEKRGDLD